MQNEDEEAVISLRFGRLPCSPNTVRVLQNECFHVLLLFPDNFGSHFRWISTFLLTIKKCDHWLFYYRYLRYFDSILPCCFDVGHLLGRKPKSITFLLLFVFVCPRLCLSNNIYV